VAETPDPIADLRRIAQDLISRGNALRDAGGEQLGEALATYQQAIETLTPFLPDPENPDYRDDLGSAWTNQGIAWMLRGGPVGLKSALTCFERAVEVRTPLLGLGEPRYRYHLAGAWLNHGDVLARLKLSDRPEANPVASYDQAIALLQELPRAGNPLFCRRLMLAWINRGSILLRTNPEADRESALQAFAAAIETGAACSDDSLVATLAAAAWINTAEALSQAGSWAQAQTAARRALAAIAGQEKASAEGALLGLRGRLALCLLAARRGGESASEGARLTEAIEIAEGGLSLAGKWKTDARFAPLLLEFFRLGAEAYARWQPHFLVEFLEEYGPLARAAGGDAAVKPIAAQAITQALSQVARAAFPALHQPGIERALATFRQLREAAEQFR
jgi:tetratricopeptide (TPR) repeat protein